MNTNAKPSGPCDIHAAVSVLWEVAADQLDKEILGWLAGADPEEFSLRCLADSVDNLAGLVVCDDGDDSQPRSGAFANNGNVSALLVALANSMRGVAALMLLRSEASTRLLHPEIFAPTAARAERRPAASRPRPATLTVGV